MSAPFKIQKLSVNIKSESSKNRTNMQSAQSQNPSLKQITLQLPKISLLKYNSHALIQVLGMMFQNSDGMLPYKQIQKSLQILSFSLNDSVIKNDFQSLLVKNLHKRTEMYLMFCIWCKYAQITDLIKLLDNKLTKQILNTIIFTYLGNCFKNLIFYQDNLKNQLKNLLVSQLVQKNIKVFQQIDSQIQNLQFNKYEQFCTVLNKILSLVINHAFLSHSSSLIFISLVKILNSFLKCQGNINFVRSFVRMEIIQSKSCQKQPCIIQTFLQLLQSINQLKQTSNIMLKHFNNIVNDKFNSVDQRVELFQLIKQKYMKNSSFVNKAYQCWFGQNIQKIWIFFNENYKLFHINLQKQQKIMQIQNNNSFLLTIMQNISSAGQSVNMNIRLSFYSKYLFHFFEGRPINLPLETKFLQNSQQKSFKQQKQLILKQIKQIKNDGFLNLLLFNKSTFPSCVWWEKDPDIQQLIKNYESNSSMKKLLSLTQSHYKDISQKLLKNNKKIDSIYNVIIIKIDGKTFYMTISQIANFLKDYADNKSINLANNPQKFNYQTVYSPHLHNQSQSRQIISKTKPQQQIHPIVIQARIIKLMKKQVKKASIQQISKLTKINIEKVQQSVKKLTTKGFLQEHENKTYQYQP